jgi:phage terminase small subunit|tara:strand:- start:15566 stop:16156 length:591 start_codon:yes stop_codon:yes gene_type:complete
MTSKTDEEVVINKKFMKQDALIEQIIMNPSKNRVHLAMKCGYATKSIDKTVSRLMNDKVFLKRIEDRKIEIQNKLAVTADKVAEEYARIAFLDPRDYYEYTQDGGIVAKKSNITDLRPVLEIEENRSGKGANGKNQIRLKFYNKLDALKSLREMFGYDKPAKHAHLIAGSGQSLDSKGIEQAIIGLLGSTTPAPSN